MKARCTWLLAAAAFILPQVPSVSAADGSTAGLGESCCGAAGDIDGDCDVDLADYALMQADFSGPPPMTSCCFDGDCDDADPCTIDVCDEETGECVSTPASNCGGTCEATGNCMRVLECEVPYDGTINPATLTDYSCLCINEGDVLRIIVSEKAGQPGGFGPQWRLQDSSGTPVTGTCGVFSTLATADCGPYAAAGNPYQLVVEDSSQDSTGQYVAAFQRLPAASACDDVPIDCDEVVQGVTTNAADIDLLSFHVADGETTRISVVELAGSGTGYNPSWRLIDGNGRPARECGTLSSTLADDCGPLAAAGNPYRVEIEDGSANDIGSYQAHIFHSSEVTACDSAIACDSSIQSTISHVADSDRYRFLVAEGEIVRITVLKRSGSSNFGVSWRLVDGAGMPASTCGSASGTASVNCGPLPAAGNPYRIEIEDGARNEVGEYGVHMQRLTASRACDDTPLPCQTATMGRIDDSFDVDLLSFSVPHGENVRVSVVELTAGSGPNFAPNWRLIDGAGNPATACGNFVGSTSQDCGPLQASRNPYRVEIQDSSRDDVGDYEVTVNYLSSGCP